MAPPNTSKEVQQATKYRIVAVRKPFPDGFENEFSQIASVMRGTLAWIPEGQTPGYYLKSEGIDTALELQVINPSLRGRGEINPPMELSVQVRGRLIRVHSNEELYSCWIEYRGKQSFANWSANDAAPLRAEMQHCVKQSPRR